MKRLQFTFALMKMESIYDGRIQNMVSWGGGGEGVLAYGWKILTKVMQQAKIVHV
jgi:hypothetical protein